MSGLLYIVPTPVGNLGDMTARAIEVLREADVILAEDTRTTSPLLSHFNISTPLISHHKFNEHSTSAQIAERILSGQTVALVSDAGTPGISDPGFMLSRQCRRLGVPVVTLPGPTAFVPALVNSGLPCERFTFQGFLPPKKGRSSRLAEIGASPVTTVIYESPLRLTRLLEELTDVCGPDREASVSREISKKFEETVRGTLSEITAHFKENPPRGEIVVIVAPAQSKGPKIHKNKYKQ